MQRLLNLYLFSTFVKIKTLLLYNKPSYMRIFFTSLILFALHCLQAQSTDFNGSLDSVFTTSGDILVGKVLIDKDNDRFIFESKDTFTLQLLPSRIKKFTYNLVEHNGEKITYISILNDFYFLEFGENDAMKGYARYTYRAVVDDGPKYHVVTKKYCFFKGRVPFFPRLESFKNDFLLLIDDCPKVARKVQNRDIKIEEIVQYVIEYNNCSGKIKK